MKDQRKTKAQLIEELDALRSQLVSASGQPQSDASNDSSKGAADIISAMPSGFLRYRYEPPDSLILEHANPAAHRLTGLELGAYIGREFNEIWTAARDDGLTNRFLDVVRTGNPFAAEDVGYQDEKVNGAFNIRAFPLPDDRLGVAFDNVIQQQRVQTALEESEAFHRETLASISDAVFITDEHGTLKFVCPNVDAIFGWSTAEVEEMGALHALVGDNPLRPAGIRTAEEIRNVEWSVVDKHGRPHSLLVNVKRVNLKGGTLLYICRDVTELKETERALRRERSRLTHVLNSIPAFVYVQRKDHTIGFFNDHFRRVFGEPESRLCYQIIHERDEPCEDCPTLRVLETGEACAWEWTAPSGRTFIIHDQVIPDEDGEPVVLEVGIDITQRKRAEEEAQLRQQQLIQADRMKSLGILVSGVAHELNNPNQFIMMSLSLIQKAWEGIEPILDAYHDEQGDYLVGGLEYTIFREELPDWLSQMSAGSERIKNIVAELRDFARERPADLSENVDVNKVVRSAVVLLTNMLKKTTNDLVVQHDEKCPPIRGSFQRLEQVLVNLIQNACQALRSRSDTIRVATEYNEKEGIVVVSVQDHGVGIARDYLPHLTDPFFTTRRDIGGTGLGLSVSHGIVEEHGGALTFESELDQGTTVRVSLPVQVVPAGAQKGEEVRPS